MEQNEFRQLLSDPDLSQRLRALASYVFEDPFDIEATISAITPRLPVLHTAALSAAKRSAYEIASPLLEILVKQGATPEIRVDAIQAIQQNTTDVPPLVVSESAHDPDYRVRLAALSALENRPGDATVQILLYYLSNPAVNLDSPGHEDAILESCIKGIGFRERDSVVPLLAEYLVPGSRFRSQAKSSLKRILSSAVHETLLNLLYDDTGALKSSYDLEFQYACVELIAEVPPEEGLFLERYREFINTLWGAQIAGPQPEVLSPEFIRLFNENSIKIVDAQIKVHADNATVIHKIVAVLGLIDFGLVAQCWLGMLDSVAPAILPELLSTIHPLLEQHPQLLAEIVAQYVQYDLNWHGPERLPSAVGQMSPGSIQDFFDVLIHNMPEVGFDTPQYRRLVTYLDVVWQALSPTTGTQILEKMARAFLRNQSGGIVFIGFISKQLMMPVESGEISLWILLQFQLRTCKRITPYFNN